jgi:hypothetical protein
MSHFLLELGDPIFAGGDIRVFESLRDNMPQAIGVPGGDSEQNRLFGHAFVVARSQPLQQCRVVGDDARVAPDIDPFAGLGGTPDWRILRGDREGP